MNTTLTLNKLKIAFEDIAERHQMINDFGWGPSYNIGTEASMNFPYLWVEPVSSRTTSGSGNSAGVEYYTFNMYVMDKIDGGDGNYAELISDMDYITKTIFAELDINPIYVSMELSIDGDFNGEPAYEDEDDNVNGWVTNFTLKQPMRYNPCNSPILSIDDCNCNPSGGSGSGTDGATGPTGPQGATGPIGLSYTYSLVQGGEITLGNFNAGVSIDDVLVSTASYFIDPDRYTSGDTYFYDIPLSGSGLQRYIGFYGTTNSIITKVEGSESQYASVPTAPTASAIIGYLLVSDSGGTTIPPTDITLPYTQIAYGSNLNTLKSSPLLTYDETQLSVSGSLKVSGLTGTGNRMVISNSNGVIGVTALSYQTVNAKPQTRVQVLTTTSSLNVNADLYDETNVTALSSNITFVNPTGTFIDGQKLIYRWKDDGTSRTITLDTAFVDLTGDMVAATTISKVGLMGVRWAASRSMWEILAVVSE